MSGSGQVVVAGLGLHDVGHQDVLAVHDEVLLAQGEVRIAGKLVKGAGRNAAFLLGRRRAHDGSRRGLLFPVEARRLH